MSRGAPSRGGWTRSADRISLDSPHPDRRSTIFIDHRFKQRIYALQQSHNGSQEKAIRRQCLSRINLELCLLEDLAQPYTSLARRNGNRCARTGSTLEYMGLGEKICVTLGTKQPDAKALQR